MTDPTIRYTPPPTAQPPVGSPPTPPPTWVAAPPPANGPGLLIRAIWFIFVGWWLSGVAVAVGYVMCAIIIGIPIGFMIFNQLPLILTLRPRSPGSMADRTVEQLPLWIRAVWFILVGWWLGAIYMAVAYVLCLLIITLPVGLYLFNRVGAVMTMLRY